MKKMYSALLAIALPSLLLCQYSAFAETPKKIDSLMAQWISLESQKSQLLNDWKNRKSTLELQLKLLSTEESSLKELLEQSDTNKDAVENERASLVERQTTLEKQQTFVKEHIQNTKIILQTLSRQLPPPLQSESKDALASLSQEAFANSEKLEKALAFLDKMNGFQNRISINQTTMSIQQGETQKEIYVKQIYLGLSQGWYVSAQGEYYGYGQPDQGEWRWWHQEAASQHLENTLKPSDILSAIGMVENPSLASLLTLPVKLQKPTDLGANQ